MAGTTASPEPAKAGIQREQNLLGSWGIGLGRSRIRGLSVITKTLGLHSRHETGNKLR